MRRASTLDSIRERRSQAERLASQVNSLAASAIGALERTVFVVSRELAPAFTSWLDVRSLTPSSVVIDHGDAISQVKKLLKAENLRPAQFVCIIGTWEDVPPIRVSFEIPGDPDEFCLTDAPYGCTDDIDLDDILSVIPAVPVGRIPSSDMSVIERLLCEPHQQAAPAGDLHFAVTADCWRDATQAIIDSISAGSSVISGPPQAHLARPLPRSSLLTSPDWHERDVRAATDGKLHQRGGFLLFNVHGSPDETHWVGEGTPFDFVTVFRPGTIQDYANATLVTEACYGGAMGYADTSIVEHFFSHGGRCFVGSSAVAYGCSGPELAAADILVLDFIAALGQGLSCGEALTHAKLAVLDDDPMADLMAQKTALSFNLYGAPWQTIRLRSVVDPVRSGSLNERVRARLDALSERAGSLDRIRERYRQRLPVTLRSFLQSSDQMISMLRSFQDYTKINSVLQSRRGDLSKARLDQLSVDGGDAWRLFCPVGTNHKGLMIFLIGSKGQLKKTLMSKGQR